MRTHKYEHCNTGPTGQHRVVVSVRERVGVNARRAPTFGLDAEARPEPGDIALPGLYDDAFADVGGGFGVGRGGQRA